MDTKRVELEELPSHVLVEQGVVAIPEEIRRAYRSGDRLVSGERTTDLLLIPRSELEHVSALVRRAELAFATLQAAPDARIARFFDEFAARLADEQTWPEIRARNRADVRDAAGKGRSTTRLVADDAMRVKMIDGLRGWRDAPSRRGQVLETHTNEHGRFELVGAPLGVIGFVFEGRPNVLADAAGVLRGGNATILRIGRDALRTARGLMDIALTPALRAAQLPEDAVILLDSPEHSAAWALFSNPRLSLAVARGSGPAVRLLGALAQRSGVPVSLHGTGGAWIVVSRSANGAELEEAVLRSLDRKVCNTLNTCCVERAAAEEMVPLVLAALAEASRRLARDFRLHVTESARSFVPSELFQRAISVGRARGECSEAQASLLADSELGREWEWECNPEISLTIVETVAEAVALFNRHSPKFVASLISDEQEQHDRFYATVDAPFVGDGYTRWVDGQLALGRPELGLANWERGRLFGRAGILSGDNVFTIRVRASRR